MKITIVIAAHKPITPPENRIYLLCETNAINNTEHFSAFRDDQGINISAKNKNYCELTAIYAAYKNLDYDVLGLVHYRRYFVKNRLLKKKSLADVIDEKYVAKTLEKYDAILPKKRHYYIESNYSHYIHSHKQEALDKTGKIIDNFYPEYSQSFHQTMKRRSGHYFNMFVMKKFLADKYLSFVFEVLEKLESEINLAEYPGEDQRVFGFIGELLMDTFVFAHKLKVKNQSYFFVGNQNWPKKIGAFLRRKFKK